MRFSSRPLILATALALSTLTAAQAETRLLNVSYDPTREFYREYNELFNTWWTAQGNPPVSVQQSHGGSGAQARAVIDGLDAQVLTLAMSADIDAVASRTGKVPQDWQELLPENSAPYTSTIVFIVRAGNPKNIKDWDDLLREDVSVITPNPKTSGVARWNYLAAWAYADRKFGGDEEKIREFVGNVYRNVPVLDTAARGATTTFVQRGIGDVLLNWENEAFLALAEFGTDTFAVVLPSVSILAEPVVALVEGNLHNDEQAAAARAYLQYLFSPAAQALTFKHGYRGFDTSAADPADVERFPEIERVSVNRYGGWAAVQPEHFGDGGIFDQIFEE
ncbi:sulfate ABC transporter substrate-binding protein [Thioalkalicoccus limnaeus]|uniref:Sulfate ABC transporter substrate-binding protein n=1 Tax=Thioalkalicoccus limnaeus TaxID=120681 RepID=A0ABV4BBZ9_9GAMM